MGIIHLFRFPITIFLLGVVVNIFGSYLRIMHHPNNQNFLLAGAILEAAGVMAAIIILWQQKKAQ